MISGANEGPGVDLMKSTVLGMREILSDFLEKILDAKNKCHLEPSQGFLFL